MESSQSQKEIQILVDRFRNAAVEKDIFAKGKRNHQLYEIMRNSYHHLKDLGRDEEKALESLLDDQSTFVRSWIASALMVEGNAKARKTLEEISKMSGMEGFSARITLLEFDAGKLGKPFPPSK